MVNGLLPSIIAEQLRGLAIYFWVITAATLLERAADRQRLHRARTERVGPTGCPVGLRRRLTSHLAGDAAEEILGHGVGGREHRHIGAQQLAEAGMAFAEGPGELGVD